MRTLGRPCARHAAGHARERGLPCTPRRPRRALQVLSFGAATEDAPRGPRRSPHTCAATHGRACAQMLASVQVYRARARSLHSMHVLWCALFLWPWQLRTVQTSSSCKTARALPLTPGTHEALDRIGPFLLVRRERQGVIAPMIVHPRDGAPQPEQERRPRLDLAGCCALEPLA